MIGVLSNEKYIDIIIVVVVFFLLIIIFNFLISKDEEKKTVELKGVSESLRDKLSVEHLEIAEEIEHLKKVQVKLIEKLNKLELDIRGNGEKAEKCILEAEMYKGMNGLTR